MGESERKRDVNTETAVRVMCFGKGGQAPRNACGLQKVENGSSRAGVPNPRPQILAVPGPTAAGEGAKLPRCYSCSPHSI